MKTWSLVLLVVLMLADVDSARASAPQVDTLTVEHRHGQTFLTWKDAAEGEAGAMLRYQVLRSPIPITANNADQAEMAIRGILNHSGRLFGTAFLPADRLDATKPMSILTERDKPLPPWSGLAVVTVPTNRESYYAVRVTDAEGRSQGPIAPGKNATTTPIAEQTAPIQPIKIYDSHDRPSRASKQFVISGRQGLPLFLSLHGGQPNGGGASNFGDYYLFFSRPDWGFRDGLPGVFSVEEHRGEKGNAQHLVLVPRDALEHPDGRSSAFLTMWFGYAFAPEGAGHAELRAYPFTERRMDWMLQWVVNKYGVDRNRIAAGGGSIGALGSTTYAFHRPQWFAAVYPNRPPTRWKKLQALVPRNPLAPIKMADGMTEFSAAMDTVQWVSEHHEDLPFFGFCCGRRDPYALWPDQMDMVRALTAGHHGFAFAWNDGDHVVGAEPMQQIRKCYPAELFALNQSYPAFGNSSLDDDLGHGDPKDGDLEGGINLGFRWMNVTDEANRWTIEIANDLATADMTVDVTPRRCQEFKPPPGSKVRWKTDSVSGEIVVDRWGLATLEQVRLSPRRMNRLELSRN